MKVVALSAYSRLLFVVSLTLGLVMSPTGISASHDPTTILQIFSQHQHIAEPSGDADAMRHILNHAHEMADHDHNVVYWHPEPSAIENPINREWAVTQDFLSNRRALALYRPPRV